jgi:outer membrane protein OmpA-like peptidoglycan-associated protein
VVLIPDENGSVGRVLVRNDEGSAELAEPLAAVSTARGTAPGVFKTNRETVDRTFAGALAATPRSPVIYVIYFLSALAEIDPRSSGELARAVAAARATANADISVVGHSDATGNDAQNLTLSLERARRIRDALVAGGVATEIIELEYHGSNNPRVPRPRGVPEPANRRVEVTIR